MTHLGADVAAFVDGQLSEQSMDAARAHLATCPACEKAVRQQEALKSRMSTVAAPALSASFLASLSEVPRACVLRESVWDRVRHSRSVRTGVVLFGASLAVAVVAYAFGGTREHIGDAVAPASDLYAADFYDSSSSPAVVQASSPLTPEALTALDDSGWPCHETIAGDMHRVDAAWLDGGNTIALTYASEIHKLKLFEQTGSLDTDSLEGFEERTIDRARVWVRDGIPQVVTWDHDGVVYTIVTDAGRQRLRGALADLPTPAPDGGPAERIGDGIDRMATWISPAA